MKIAETQNEGLNRAYTLTIEPADIQDRIAAEVARLAPQVRMPGFRPGKVPANLVRKMHGAQLTQEALNAAVSAGVQKVLADHQLRPAMQPSVEPAEGFSAEKGGDIAVTLEVLPQIPTPAIDTLKLERLLIDVKDADIDAALQELADSQKAFEDAPAKHKAARGDLVLLDFVGKIDGEAFDGGSAKEVGIEIGAGRMIPGFEDQLEGVKANDEKTITVTFPDDYGVAYLKGKEAKFDLTVNAVRTPKAIELDDEFAKTLGLEGIDQLRTLMKEQLERQYGGLTRTHMKRKLLDQLAAAPEHQFDVPKVMLEAEFDQIWQQLEQEAAGEDDPEAARAEMESERDDYRRIAERRVRLGLLLSEIGSQAGIEVNQNEMNQLIMQAAQHYEPKDRQRFVEYVQQEPMAAAQLRAPLYEDKVVDHLFAMAQVTERSSSKEELEAAIEADEDGVPAGHVHGPDCGHDHHHGHDDHGHVHGPDCDHGHDAEKPKKAAKAKPAPKAAKADGAKAEAAEDAAPKKAAPKKSPPKGDAGSGEAKAPARKASVRKAD